MNHASTDSDFLAAGLQYFPEARAAVSAFRRLITEKVEQILNATRQDVWSPTTVKTTRSESNGLWVGAGGPMVLSSPVGKSLVLDVGIWWKASHLREPIAAVAVVYGAKEIFEKPLEPKTDNDVRLVRNGSRQDHFVTRLGADASDVEDALRRVVEAAASAVAAGLQSTER